MFEAAVYLRDERGFDLDELWERWEIYYCHYWKDRVPNRRGRQQEVLHRIVIPIYTLTRRLVGNDWVEERTLAGWQARYVGEPEDRACPKYLNAEGVRKSQCLYGLPQAVDSPGPLLVVEGVTDCWRLFPNAVSIFGTEASVEQLSFLRRHFRHRPIAIVLDEDASAKAQRILDQVQLWWQLFKIEQPVVRVTLPPGLDDPAACNPEDVRRLVTEAFRQRGGEGPAGASRIDWDSLWSTQFGCVAPSELPSQARRRGSSAI